MRRNGQESPSSTPARIRPRRWPPGRHAAPRSTRRSPSSTAAAATPSPGWKVRFGLLLGLERVLSSKPPATAAGTELRKHQIDALAGMLTELIAANQRQAEDLNGNGNGHAEAELEAEDAEEEDELEPADEDAEAEDETGFTGEDPGAVRRYRFRHPTASGKTIAAAGFVEAARRSGSSSSPTAACSSRSSSAT